MPIVKKPYVRNNENLKAPNSVEYVTKEEYQRRVTELIRCKNDPIYFANNYYYIVSPGKGKHRIKLYAKQEELIQAMVDNDRLCCLASRQVGKCCFYKSKIKIRKKSTKDVHEISIGELYDNISK